MEIELKLGGVGVEVEIEGVGGLATALGLAALGAAVAQELRAPPHERTWHGHVAGLVPYDLRPPTPARLRAALWQPGNPAVLVPTAFGVGWTVNAAALASRLGVDCTPDRPAAEPEPEPAH